MIKHRYTKSNQLQIELSRTNITLLESMHDNISEGEAMRRTFLFEVLMQCHCLYEDKPRNNLLCPLMDLLSSEFSGSVVITNDFGDL